MPDCYSTRFDDAAAFAIAAFRGVRRKSTPVPYITHLFSVCALVGEYGGDEEQMMAALLHDWLEDVHGATEEVLAERFGQRVASMVAALSDSDAPAPGKKKPEWRGRKEKYLAHLREAPHEVKLVSCADKLHNCQTIRADQLRVGNSVFERFAGRKDGTLWYYDAVCEALGQGWDSALLHRLQREVAAMQATARDGS